MRVEAELEKQNSPLLEWTETENKIDPERGPSLWSKSKTKHGRLPDILQYSYDNMYAGDLQVMWMSADLQWVEKNKYAFTGSGKDEKVTSTPNPDFIRIKMHNPKVLRGEPSESPEVENKYHWVVPDEVSWDYQGHTPTAHRKSPYYRNKYGYKYVKNPPSHSTPTPTRAYPGGYKLSKRWKPHEMSSSTDHTKDWIALNTAMNDNLRSSFMSGDASVSKFNKQLIDIQKQYKQNLVKSSDRLRCAFPHTHKAMNRNWSNKKSLGYNNPQVFRDRMFERVRYLAL